MKIILTAILSVWALSLTAGLPPTSGKVSSDSADVVAFKFRFPNFTGTHTGTILSLGVNSIAGGGTGALTKATAFDALSPMSAQGDIVYGGASGTGTRLPIGSTSNYLTVTGGVPAWTSVSPNTIKIATIKDVKTSGTAGGTFTSGSYATRTLNTLSDPTSIVTSLASNQFVLPAGTYHIHATAPAHQVGLHKARLQNITDATTDIIGTSESAAAAQVTVTHSIVDGVITISGSKTFEIQHRCASTEATDGYGRATSFSDSEIFTQVTIEKM
jgi:hypothetical protein